jgi:hypothetical protein
MSIRLVRKYLVTCGLLLLPVFIWNAALMGSLPPVYLPDEYWRNIPDVLGSAENLMRSLILTIPFLMPLSVSSSRQRIGMGIFIAGNLVYFASWIALILAPDSIWSHSAIGFLASAYTPLIWFFGLALLSHRLFWGNFYRWWMYFVLCCVFLAVHITHAVIVFVRYV